MSKAIDRLNGKPLERMREFGQWMRSQREAAGLTAAEVNRTMEMPQGCGWWEGKGVGEKWDLHPPSLETFARLKKLYGAGDDWDWFVEWAEAERERIGTNPNIERARQSGGEIAFGHGSFDDAITAPATPEAQRWQGWGTALKPAHEPIVVARKPLIGTVAQTVSEFGTGALNIDGCRINASSPPQASASGGEPFGDGSYELGEGRRYQDEGVGRWPANVCLSHLPECQRVGERRVKPGNGSGVATRGLVEDEGATSLYGFGGGDETPRGHTDSDGLETVEAWSCVTSDDGAASARIWSSVLDSLGGCPSCRGFCDGQSHRVIEVAQALPPLQPGAVVVGTPSLRATLEGIQQSLFQFPSKEGDSRRPSTAGRTSESKSVPASRRGAGRETGSDNARKESPEPELSGGRDSSAASNTACSSGSCERSDHSLCRAEAVRLLVGWASVEIVSQSCAVAELDRQSGESRSGGGRIGNKDGGAIYGGGKGLAGEFEAGDPGFGDTGGASRFFYVAKSSKAERTAGVGINAHPT